MFTSRPRVLEESDAGSRHKLIRASCSTVPRTVARTRGRSAAAVKVQRPGTGPAVLDPDPAADDEAADDAPVAASEEAGEGAIEPDSDTDPAAVVVAADEPGTPDDPVTPEDAAAVVLPAATAVRVAAAVPPGSARINNTVPVPATATRAAARMPMRRRRAVRPAD